jgi:hypothetical protein
MIICECGEIIENGTFRDYIKTSAGPSTPTIGHKKCGHIFNFIDGKRPKKYSSRTELKNLAIRFADRNKLEGGDAERLLLEVDRLKSSGNLSDHEILSVAYSKVIE